MKVRDRMSPNPIVISPDTSVVEAFQLMRDKGIRRLPVMDKGKLVGIVTLQELYEVLPSPATTLSVHEANYLLAKTKIKDIMPKNMKMITIEPDANLERAAALMRENKIGGIPVVENGHLVGIITETDIFDAFVDILAVKKQGARIDLEVEDRVGVVAQITSMVARRGINIENIVLIPKKNTNRYELILRLGTTDIKDLVDELKREGFEVVETLIKN